MGITGHWPTDPGAVTGAAAFIVALLLLAGGLAWRERQTSARAAAVSPAAPTARYPAG
jgi:hypothetical protein